MKALVVEDQQFIQVIVERLLKKEFNYEVFKAFTGIEGLESYVSIKPDIIFLDISMPDMNGVELLKKIRTEIGDTTTKVVIMTANTNRELFQQLRELGISDYILKPITYDLMRNRVREIVGGMNLSQPKPD